MARMQYFTQDELKRFLKAIEDTKRRNRKMEAWKLKLLVLVSYWHGLRVSEAIGLTGKQVQNGLIDVARLKNSEHTIQKLQHPSDPALQYAEALEHLAKWAGPDGLLFPITRFGAYYLMQRTGKRAGVPWQKCHSHALKHSIARHTIKEVGIENVRKHLGHKSGASTLEYLKVTDADADEAFAKAAAAGA